MFTNGDVYNIAFSFGTGGDAVAHKSPPGFFCYLHGGLDGGELVAVCKPVWKRFLRLGRTWAERGQNVRKALLAAS